MTTTIMMHVNGRYRATVVQTTGDGKKLDPVVVYGNYQGSPNPSGARSFYLAHPATSTFEVTEEAVPEAPPTPEQPPAAEEPDQG